MCDKPNPQLAIPKEIQCILSFPDLDYTEFADIVEKAIANKKGTFLYTDLKLRVLAQTQDIIVLEATKTKQ